MSSTNRRSFLARGAALATVPTIATLAGGALTEQASAATLPNYAPIPRSALGPAINAQGYYVGRVERNLYWITDSTYQAAFLTTSEGVQAAQVAYASAPVIKKYTGVLGAADVYTASTTFVILESVRLDLGVGSQVHA
jgi:hypothetical protein